MGTRTIAPDALRILQDYAALIAEASQPDDAFRAAEKATQVLIGHRLFTVMAFDPARMEVRRCFSSDPDNYPAGGRKKKRDTEWGHQVLEQGRIFIGANVDDIRRYFDDHEVIVGLGLCAVLNIPIKRFGKTVGTMNLLDRTPHYAASDAKSGAVIAMGLVAALG